MYEIEFTAIARSDLKAFRKFEQVKILEGIEDQLRHEPSKETRNRKRLRLNEPGAWELRLGRFRIFYNVIEEGAKTVQIEAIGFKVGGQLFIRGRKSEP